MKNVCGILSFLAVLFSGALAQAAVPDGTMIGADTLRPLASWVERATGTHIKALPIVMASGIRLKTSLGLEGVQQARSIAAYLPGQIIINNIIWDPESLRSQSYIVHEMVHHAQLLSGKTYACHAAKEKEAYMLQNRWLVEHGEEAMVDNDWINDIASCGKNS